MPARLSVRGVRLPGAAARRRAADPGRGGRGRLPRGGRGVRAARDRDPHRHRQGQTPREERRETPAEGSCKLVVSRSSRLILVAHIVGEQAVEVVQLAAAAMRANVPVEQHADLELAYPTFTSVVGLAARRIVCELDPASPRQRVPGSSDAAEWEHSAGKAFRARPSARLPTFGGAGFREIDALVDHARVVQEGRLSRARGWDRLLGGCASTLPPSTSRCRFRCSARFSKNFWATALVTRLVTGPSRWRGSVVT
jgi:hypothetical protein